MDYISLFLKSVLPLVGYYYYHTYFSKSLKTMLTPALSYKAVFWISFFINYLSFIIYSQMELHLIVNWTLFTVLLVAELHILYQCPWGQCLFHGLTSTLAGLSFNIFFRSLLAVFLNVPPQAFDNNIYTLGNIKAYPVALGFLATGYLYKYLSSSGWDKKIAALAEDKNSLKFITKLMLAMYVYLTLNLLLYYTPKDILFLKLWSLKTSISVLIGFYIAVLFTSRMNELNEYRQKNLKVKKEIAEKEREEQRLFMIVHTDPLTKLFTRSCAEQELEKRLGSDCVFSLCFVDLNGLKYVNDTLGHQSGDRYLTAAANVLSSVSEKSNSLFRYGGDEFLLILDDLSPENAGILLDKAQEQLKKESGFLAPFLPSFSYGIVEQGEYSSAAEMIAEADRRMYANKLKNNKNRID